VPVEAPDRLAKETRVRLHGIDRDDADQPEAGTFIGRLKLSRQISHEQYESFVRYEMTRERYYMAINAPDSLKTRRGGVMSIPSDDDDKGAIVAWDKLTRAIMEAQKYERGNLMAALNFLVTRDEEHHHMIGDLRVVGNALCRFYGIDGMRKSA
jgi:hypothetical protein